MLTNNESKLSDITPPSSSKITDSPTSPLPTPSPPLPTPTPPLSTPTPLPDLSLKVSTPKQDKLKDQILECSKELSRLTRIRDVGLAVCETKQRISELKTKNKRLNVQLKKLVDGAKYSRESRQRRKVKEGKLLELVPPELASQASEFASGRIGRKNIEVFQPDFLRTIVEIVEGTSSADERRRSDILRSCTTLDQLVSELRARGYDYSRTAVYHRLIPRRSDTIEGKRHVRTVPVKLARATASQRKSHQDSHFAAATVSFVKYHVIYLGPRSAFFLSQDDKARIPLGLSAANKQVPILMSMREEVRLPDHDFVVATRHKLIPSVYAACRIEKSCVSYSGPTYIAIRSGKHDKSTAKSHARDFRDLCNLGHFRDVMMSEDGTSVKPVVALSVDGGPDECPR